MTNVTIFGSGNMGSAIDELLTAGGATVDHIRSADPSGPVNGDIVIFAVGPLARARELEALGFLQIKLAVTEQIGWTGGFTVVR